MRSCFRRLFLALVLTFAGLSAASAQTCSAQTTITSPVVFNGDNILGGSAIETTATLDIRCTGLLGLMQVCASLDAGSGGTVGGIRQMTREGGTEKLQYRLYQDAARTIPWGSLSNTQLGRVPGVTVVVALGGGSNSARIYARVLENQPTVPAGTYSETVPSTLNFGAVSALTGCNGLLTYSSAGPSFRVEADVRKTCMLSVPQAVDFGSAGVLNEVRLAEGRLQVRCTNQTPFKIGLGPGRFPGATVSTRRMSGPGGAAIAYDLFQNIERSVAWGNTAAALLSATGTGQALSLPVFGRLNPQKTPARGSYRDTVVVTLTY